MTLNEIKFIIEVDKLTDVNQYLSNGWILLNIYTTATDFEFAPNDLTPHYILGATQTVDYSKELEQHTNKIAFYERLDADTLL